MYVCVWYIFCVLFIVLMSQDNRFDLITSLDESKYKWKIKVRVTRMWDSYGFPNNDGTRDYKGSNMIVMDKKVTHYIFLSVNLYLSVCNLLYIYIYLFVIISISCQGNKSHLIVWANMMEKFHNVFEEGKVYIVDNFNVKPYRPDALKCVGCDKQIWLTPNSTVVRAQVDDGTILNESFDFINVDELSNLVLNPEYKYQLIGKKCLNDFPNTQCKRNLY